MLYELPLLCDASVFTGLPMARTVKKPKVFLESLSETVEVPGAHPIYY